MKNRSISSIVMVVLALWLGATLAVDFLAIPSVFKNVTNLAEAGKVGMAVFGKFNVIEVVYALLSLFFLLVITLRNRSRFNIFLLSLTLVLTAIALSYLFYFTPELARVTFAKNETFGPEMRAALESELYFLHSLYIKLDGLKMFLIVIALIMLGRKGEEL